jgi:transcriptional regulator with XRE-family HTH domain
MTQSYPIASASAGLLQLARLKSGLSQKKLADRAGVSATMISAYERDLRQPSIPTMLRLLAAAGFELRMHLEPLDQHDQVLAQLEANRSLSERSFRDLQQQQWRDATFVSNTGEA